MMFLNKKFILTLFVIVLPIYSTSYSAFQNIKRIGHLAKNLVISFVELQKAQRIVKASNSISLFPDSQYWMPIVALRMNGVPTHECEKRRIFCYTTREPFNFELSHVVNPLNQAYRNTDTSFGLPIEVKTFNGIINTLIHQNYSCAKLDFEANKKELVSFLKSKL